MTLLSQTSPVHLSWTCVSPLADTKCAPSCCSLLWYLRQCFWDNVFSSSRVDGQVQVLLDIQPSFRMSSSSCPDASGSTLQLAIRTIIVSCHRCFKQLLLRLTATLPWCRFRRRHFLGSSGPRCARGCASESEPETPPNFAL